MVIQGAVLGGVITAFVVLAGSLAYCIDDNLDVRAEYNQFRAATITANKEAAKRKKEREDASKKDQEDSDLRLKNLRTNYESRLSILHNDRNNWLSKQYPTAGKEAKGLPPICFAREEFNRSQRESEQEAGYISEQGEAYRLELQEAKRWADKQPWTVTEDTKDKE